MGSKDTICENEGRCAHSWHTDSLSFQVLNGVNVGFHTCLNAQAAAVDSGQKPDIQTLFDRFEEKHHEVMSDVEAAQSQCVLISCPVALHQFDLESLLLEKTFFDRRVNRRLASDADVTNADLIGSSWPRTGTFVAAAQGERGEN